MGKNRPQKTDLLPGAFEMLILKTLERNAQAMHGYGIAWHLEQISHEVLHVEGCSLYPALQRSLSNAGSKPSGAPWRTIGGPGSTI
jgi:DNA-binding PadR family transcriptional regulator